MRIMYIMLNTRYRSFGGTHQEAPFFDSQCRIRPYRQEVRFDPYTPTPIPPLVGVGPAVLGDARGRDRAPRIPVRDLTMHGTADRVFLVGHIAVIVVGVREARAARVPEALGTGVESVGEVCSG